MTQINSATPALDLYPKGEPDVESVEHFDDLFGTESTQVPTDSIAHGAIQDMANLIKNVDDQGGSEDDKKTRLAQDVKQNSAYFDDLKVLMSQWQGIGEEFSNFVEGIDPSLKPKFDQADTQGKGQQATQALEEMSQDRSYSKSDQDAFTSVGKQIQPLVDDGTPDSASKAAKSILDNPSDFNKTAKANPEIAHSIIKLLAAKSPNDADALKKLDPYQGETDDQINMNEEMSTEGAQLKDLAKDGKVSNKDSYNTIGDILDTLGKPGVKTGSKDANSAVDDLLKHSSAVKDILKDQPGGAMVTQSINMLASQYPDKKQDLLGLLN